MDIKRDILWRVYLVLAFMVLFGIAIMAQVFRLQFVQGTYWKSKADSLSTALKNIEAVRGNIYAADGSLLATSIPIYELRMDAANSYVSAELFNQSVDSLAMCLSNMFKDRTTQEYRRELITARKEKERYLLLQRGVNYLQLKEIRKWPIFRMGKYKGGLIVIQRNMREHPFKLLAGRTIGFDVEGQKPVGIEGAFSEYLSGISGKRLMQRISGGVWVPIYDDNEIEPKDGSDIVTTIDVNIQDVAEHALLTQLSRHNAQHGCAVLMEVATGEIRAIANLSRNGQGEYTEDYNYAVGESTEPGSTFKLASIMAALEDGLVSLDDTVDLENGKHRFLDRVMPDAHAPKERRVSVRRAFEESSNVGISKTIYKSYIKKQQDFIDRLYSFNINDELGLQITGESKPRIKGTKAKDWSGTTLPWMSIGYEVRMTPLQILNFYNTVANNGKMVKPYFVKQVVRRGEVIKNYEPEVLKTSICSDSTISKARSLLEGVVQNGTAKNLKNANYKIAGKTGTAQIARGAGGYKNLSDTGSIAGITYQASFVGYFPAENPRYSCIVVVNAPSNNMYYAAEVAGPIFKEIADKVYSTSLEMHKELGFEVTNRASVFPACNGAYRKDFKTVYHELGFDPNTDSVNTTWVWANRNDSILEVKPKSISKGLVPNVIGMGIRDAMHLLENRGLNVRVIGRGHVTKQSVEAGARAVKGNMITIELS